MSTFNTPFYRLRKPEKWLNYFNCMLNSLTVRKSATSCEITKNTTFLWRLNLLNTQDNTHLSGIVEMDETLFRHSEKGSRCLSHTRHKRDRDQAGIERAKGDWGSVFVARDRQDNIFDKRLGNYTDEAFYQLLNTHITVASMGGCNILTV
jgi:hypothetical protein